MQPLLDKLRDALAASGVAPTGICVAFSGGRDSTVLLHAAISLDLGVPVRAVHVDHGLHAASREWATRCEELCRDWRIPCRVLRVSVASAGLAGGPEAAAREARYAALRGALQRDEFLVTAHHRDDQLETVLLRLLRGAGPAGVAGIRGFTRFPPGYLVRPLLDVGARAVAAYAARARLAWIEDPSNADAGLDRNYLRLEIVPRLKERWPAADRTVSRAAGHAAEAEELLGALAALDSVQAVRDDTLRLSALRLLGAARQRNVVRAFLHERGVRPPAAAALAQGLDQLLGARPDAAPRLSWAEGELRRYRDRVFLLRCHPDQVQPPAARHWDGEAPLELGGLAGAVALHGEPRAAAGDGFTVRFRHGGERLLQHGQHVRLKTLFQDGGIVPWMRPHVPLLYRGDELLSVGGLWSAPSWAEIAGRELRWSPRERPR